MIVKIRETAKGVSLCWLIAVGAWFLGQKFPLVGGPVIAILLGIALNFIPRGNSFNAGITFTAKKILQYSIVLLGFSLNLFIVLKAGRESLAIIITTIVLALIIAYVVSKLLNINGKTATLIGVGSAICGGSAIAATAPVVKAKNEDIAEAVSTIFLFNVVAAVIFPAIGAALGLSDTGFGIWAGTAVNDTSSVVASATTWSNMVGNNTALDLAVIVKLTRTLAIIPITLVLAIFVSKKENQKSGSFNLAKIFPWFILFFILAAMANTAFNIPANISGFLVDVGKFMITMALAAIGLSTNLVKLVKNGGKALILGFCCWIVIAVSSLVVQNYLHMW